MAVFLPLIDGPDESLVSCLARIGPVLITAARLEETKQALPVGSSYLVLVEKEGPYSQESVVSWLDQGAEKVVLPLSWAKELVGILPRERIILLLDVAGVSAVTDRLRAGVSGVFLKTPSSDHDLLASISRFFDAADVYVHATSASAPSPSTIREVRSAKATLVVSASQLTLSTTSSSQINVADAFLAVATSDRPDGLFPTVVSSWAHGGRSLGLVYSSAESVKESIVTGKGVYQSRKHGLWRKGETSGATQDVVRIRLDCDADCLEFSVVQHGVGFCHLEQPSCFGELNGIAALEMTLRSRREAAPEGSYTQRLFKDPDLLCSKIREEADELCQATSKDDIAFEAADLLYFALTRCVAAGVSIVDIENCLDAKAKKLTRRAGNAKPQYVATATRKPPESQASPSAQAAKTPLPSRDAPIRMRTYVLSEVTTVERNQLLKRPVLKSEEMIAKVKPIVDEVRIKGDAALLEFTAKFDKAQLDSPIITPPFAADVLLDTAVREAIDVAYANIHKFHSAQLDKGTLVVETSPGVVCSRFSRPIARVGLYVPGGTAILPSTALMLGIPAQVAGCEEIVLATPPRPDGSISPEVLYVAHLVGASAVLKAGGAQAVAAMAYGTESVPKVDKIFGPGNQWVTAAKMLVQNDTDALVSIDMPAGPSEVLVIADHTATPAFVAADLLSQAEHGVDSQVVLVAVNLTDEHLNEIELALDAQARALPRVDIIRKAIDKSLTVKVQTVEEAITFSNDYAPEHLILHLEKAQAVVAKINNAGSIFVGPYTPESCGDYASGTNHTLPTNGFARQFSGVNTQSFQKHITSQEISEDGLSKLGPVVAILAECEGLQAHANAVRVRLRTL